MNLKQLLEALAKCHKEMLALADRIAEAKTEDEQTALTQELDAKTTEFDGLKAKAEKAKALEAAGREVAAFQSYLAPDIDCKTLNPENPPQGNKNIEVGHDPQRDAKRKKDIFLKYVRGGAKALDGEAFDAIEAKDTRIDADAAVRLPKDIVSDIVNPALGAKVILSTDATGGDTDSGAANLVAPDFRPQLLQMPVAIPTLYDLVRVIPGVNGTATWPKVDQDEGNFGGVAFTWKATEGADKAETEPVFSDFEVKTYELSGWTEMSLTALRRSAIALESTIRDLFTRACRYEWSKMILRGAGSASNQPLGILNASGVQTVNRQTATQVAWKDLTNLEFAVTMGNRYNARYLVDDSAESYMKGSVDSDKRPLFTADTANGIRRNLAGYPYMAHEFGPDLGAEGDVVFGNPQNYAWAIEEDIAIARSEHAEFKKGRVVFRLICFVGGKPIYPEAFSVLSDPSGT